MEKHPLLDGPLHGHHLLRIQHGGQVDLHPGALPSPPQDLPLLLGRRVAYGDLDEEPVQLGLGQGEGAFVLDGVLSGQHDEGLRQGEGVAFQGDLPLLHGLEQGRLGLGRGAVDLVGQQKVGEDGALAQFEAALGAVEDVTAGDVAREQVRGKLNAAEGEPQRLGQALGDEGLPQAWVVFEEHVAAGQDGGQHLLEQRALAHHGLLDLVQHLGHL